MKNKLKNLGKVDVTFGLNDVVNVFVSRFEKDLLEKQKQVSSNIQKKNGEIERELEKVKKEMEGRIEKSFENDINISLFKNNLFFFEKEKGEISYDEKEFVGGLRLFKKEKGTYGRESMLFSKSVTITNELKRVKELEKELLELKKELGNVMVELSSISRKEREIRGVISERNLKENGFEGMLEDKDIIKLIQI